MTIVNLKGTFAKDQRPNNGLDDIADYMNAHRLTRVPVIGFVEYDQIVDKVGRPKTMTVAVGAIEPLLDPDGTDPERAAEQGWQMLDQRRKRRGLGVVADTLFDVAAEPQDAPGEEADAGEGEGSVKQPDEWLDDKGSGASDA